MRAPFTWSIHQAAISSHVCTIKTEPRIISPYNWMHRARRTPRRAWTNDRRWATDLPPPPTCCPPHTLATLPSFLHIVALPFARFDIIRLERERERTASGSLQHYYSLCFLIDAVAHFCTLYIHRSLLISLRPSRKKKKSRSPSGSRINLALFGILVSLAPTFSPPVICARCMCMTTQSHTAATFARVPQSQCNVPK